MSTPAIELPGVKVLRRLAVGGMGEIFLAERDGELRVIKVLLPGASPARLELFRREREALAAVESPHVVRLLGHGEAHLELEYVDGADLHALLDHLARRGRRLPLAATLHLLDGVLAGLTALHEAGYVHRDLSPANVLIAADGRVKLTDLGVVQRLGAQSQAALRGTLHCMAPEQLAGAATGPATDVYAAGLLLYELLCGQPPTPTGAVGLAELIACRNRLPTPPSQLEPSLPEAFDALVAGALAPRPEDRPEAAGLRRAIAALGPAPESGAVVAALSGLGPSAGGPEATGVAEQRPRPEPSPRRWFPTLLGLGALGLAALVLLWPATPPSPQRAPSPPPPDAAAPAPPPSPDQGAASPPDAGRPDAAKAAVARPPRPRARPAAPRPPRLEIGGTGTTPLHVRGGGIAGLTPPQGRTEPLTGPLLLRLTGSGGSIRARLRVEPTKAGFRATLGAVEGYYTVHCNGRPRGPTPVRGLSLPLRCRLEDKGGASTSFEARLSPR